MELYTGQNQQGIRAAMCGVLNKKTFLMCLTFWELKLVHIDTIT